MMCRTPFQRPRQEDPSISQRSYDEFVSIAEFLGRRSAVNSTWAKCARRGGPSTGLRQGLRPGSGKGFDNPQPGVGSRGLRRSRRGTHAVPRCSCARSRSRGPRQAQQRLTARDALGEPPRSGVNGSGCRARGGMGRRAAEAPRANPRAEDCRSLCLSPVEGPQRRARGLSTSVVGQARANPQSPRHRGTTDWAQPRRGDGPPLRSLRGTGRFSQGPTTAAHVEAS